MKPYYDESGIQIYLGDCLDVLPQLEAIQLRGYVASLQHSR